MARAALFVRQHRPAVIAAYVSCSVLLATVVQTVTKGW